MVGLLRLAGLGARDCRRIEDTLVVRQPMAPLAERLEFGIEFIPALEPY